MAVKRKAVRTIVVLMLKGRFIGDEETDQLEKAILGEAASGNTRLILDMREVTLVTTAFMTVLVKARANYVGRSGEIKLCSLVDTVERQLHIPQLLSKFDHHNTEEEAIAAFVESATRG